MTVGRVNELSSLLNGSGGLVGSAVAGSNDSYYIKFLISLIALK